MECTAIALQRYLDNAIIAYSGKIVLNILLLLVLHNRGSRITIMHTLKFHSIKKIYEYWANLCG